MLSKKKSKGPEDADDDEKKKVSSLSICLRLFFFLFVLLAMLFSIATLSSCEFIFYDARFLGANNTQWPIAELNNGTDLYFATLGITRWAPGEQSCRTYADVGALSTAFQTSYVTGIVAACAGIAALVLVAFELLCLRFYCSRTFALLCLLVGFLAQCLVFIAYASDYCTSYEGYPYTCSADTGTYFGIVAVTMYLVSLMFVCCTPKDKPILRLLIEMDLSSTNDNNDPCCYCCAKKPEEEEEEVDEEQKESEAVPQDAEPAPVPVPVPVPVQQETTESYPKEVYTSTSTISEGVTPLPTPYTTAAYQTPPTLPSGYMNAEVEGSDLFFDTMTV